MDTYYYLLYYLKAYFQMPRPWPRLCHMIRLGGVSTELLQTLDRPLTLHKTQPYRPDRPRK